MQRRRWFAVLAVLGVAILCYASFRAGVVAALGRSAYLQSIPVREEQVCVERGDIECLRAHWRLRAALVVGTARAALESPLPAAFEPELRSYVQWFEELPPLVAPTK
jgi:hypothetical protein